jgi:hypothetical protein
VVLLQGIAEKARRKCPENGQIRSTKHEILNKFEIQNPNVQNGFLLAQE